MSGQSSVKESYVPSTEELIGRVVFDEKQINGIVMEQSKRAIDFCVSSRNTELTLITVKEGAKPYANDLKQKIIENLAKINHNINIIEDSIKVKSYNGVVSGDIEIVENIKTDVRNKSIIVIDDILDTGKTSDFLYEYFRAKEIKDFDFSVFIKRGFGEKKKYRVDIGTITSSLLWFVGYGLDYYGYYRELPYLAEIKEKYMTQ